MYDAPVGYHVRSRSTPRHGIRVMNLDRPYLLRYQQIYCRAIGAYLLRVFPLSVDKTPISKADFALSYSPEEVMFEGNGNKPFNPNNCVIHEYISGEAHALPKDWSIEVGRDGLTTVKFCGKYMLHGYNNFYRRYVLDEKQRPSDYTASIDAAGNLEIVNTWYSQGIHYRYIYSGIYNDLSGYYSYTYTQYHEYCGQWIRDGVPKVASENFRSATVDIPIPGRMDISIPKLGCPCRAHEFGHQISDADIESLYKGLPILNVNNIENMLDILDAPRAILDLPKKFGKSLERLKANPLKSLASGYLSKIYGYDNVMRDLSDISKYFDVLKSYNQDLGTVLHSHGILETHPINGRGEYNISIKTGAFYPSFFERTGLSLNLSNTWDTVPLSFVLDWFVNLGNQLKYIDHTILLDRVIKCKQPILSYKAVIFERLDSIGNVHFTNVEHHIYTRAPMACLPVPNKDIEVGSFVTHGVEGLALFLSKKR